MSASAGKSVIQGSSSVQLSILVIQTAEDSLFSGTLNETEQAVEIPQVRDRVAIAFFTAIGLPIHGLLKVLFVRGRDSRSVVVTYSSKITIDGFLGKLSALRDQLVHRGDGSGEDNGAQRLTRFKWSRKS